MNEEKTFKWLVSNFKEYIDAAKNGEVQSEGESFIFIGTSDEMDSICVTVHGNHMALAGILTSALTNDEDLTNLIVHAMMLITKKQTK